MTSVVVHRIEAGKFPSNAYLCYTRHDSDCFLIDPGLDGHAIDHEVCERKLTPKAVFCTHGHFDHIGSAAYFQKKYGANVYLHRHDVKTAKACNFMLMAFKIGVHIQIPVITPVDDNTFAYPILGGHLRFQLIPGHTPGSCLIHFGNSIFSGDSLYARGVGLSDIPGENAEQLRASLLSVWDRIPPTSTVYPGHGQSATFRDIKADNKALAEFLGLSARPCLQTTETE